MIRGAVVTLVAVAALGACVPGLPGGTLTEPTSGAAGGPSTSGTGGMAASTGSGTAAMGGAFGPGIGGSAVTGTGAAGGAAAAPLVPPLVVDGGRPGNIAVDATNVYYVNRRAPFTLMKVPIVGGSPTPVAPVTAFSAWVAADGQNVYWSDGPGGTTQILKLAPGGTAPTTLATGVDIINRFAVGRDGVYWTTAAGTVMQVDLAGGTPTALATGQVNPTEIVVDHTDVYWVRTDTFAIMRTSISGGEPVEIMRSPDGVPISLAVDETFVYWVGNGNRAVMRASLAVGTPEVVFPFLTMATSVAVDASGLYWTDPSGIVFVGQPTTRTDGRAFATSGNPPAFGVVLAPTGVYWIGGGAGSIFRMAR
jgi:hypothetical protein